MNFEKEPIIIHIDTKYVYPHNCKLIRSNGNQHIFFFTLKKLTVWCVSHFHNVLCICAHTRVLKYIHMCVCNHVFCVCMYRLEVIVQCLLRWISTSFSPQSPIVNLELTGPTDFLSSEPQGGSFFPELGEQAIIAVPRFTVNSRDPSTGPHA